MSNISKPKNKGLGKGLSALIEEINLGSVHHPGENKGNEDNSTLAVSTLPLDVLQPSSFQPRRYFSETQMRELAESIKQNGVMQPIVVRPISHGRYEIIAGERRWRASKMAQAKNIPVVIRELTDKQALEFALIENIQRQDLTPLEEAEGYKRIMDEFRYTQEQLSDTLGKSRSHIANMLRLLSLPTEVKELVEQGEITPGHARTLIGLDNAAELAKTIIAKKLSVRQTEQLIKQRNKADSDTDTTSVIKTDKPKKPVSATLNTAAKDEDIIALEQAVSASLGLHVSIDDSSDGGKVTIQFSTLEQLDVILQKLNGGI